MLFIGPDLRRSESERYYNLGTGSHGCFNSKMNMNDMDPVPRPRRQLTINPPLVFEQLRHRECNYNLFQSTRPGADLQRVAVPLVVVVLPLVRMSSGNHC